MLPCNKDGGAKPTAPDTKSKTIAVFSAAIQFDWKNMELTALGELAKELKTRSDTLRGYL